MNIQEVVDQAEISSLIEALGNLLQIPQLFGF